MQLIANGPGYDVVVTDIIMPKVSGIDMTQKIRMVNNSVQIIVMTGEPTVETAIKAVQNGANDYLTKPISREDLLKTVRHAAQMKNLIDKKNELEKQNMLYQKNLENLVDKRTNELQSAMQSIISLLSTVVEARDSYTAGHQRRVGNLAAMIAKKMGLDSKTAEYLRIIGYIHDIGKIMIPTEILSKTGKLSDLELQMIQHHPGKGYEMLGKVELPVKFAETIYQHHERCDGSGYPRSLSQDDITLEAKILMVADVVESMTSHRPYRPALGINAAIEELKANRGTRYAEDVVDACIALFQDDHFIIDDTEYFSLFPL